MKKLALLLVLICGCDLCVKPPDLFSYGPGVFTEAQMERFNQIKAGKKSRMMRLDRSVLDKRFRVHFYLGIMSDIVFNDCTATVGEDAITIESHDGSFKIPLKENSTCIFCYNEQTYMINLVGGDYYAISRKAEHE